MAARPGRSKRAEEVEEPSVDKVKLEDSDAAYELVEPAET